MEGLLKKPAAVACLQQRVLTCFKEKDMKQLNTHSTVILLRDLWAEVSRERKGESDRQIGFGDSCKVRLLDQDVTGNLTH